jgi:adenine deaminase
MPMTAHEWIQTSRRLVDVAMGRAPADLVIRGGRWVCVQSGEIIPETDIAVADGRIAYVGPAAQDAIGPATKVLEADDRWLVPGLLDGHMHVESGMLTVTEFVRAVLPHGTTGMFIDPHEIANVLGLEGVRLMAQEAAVQPIHVWVQVPSCVPSVPGFETPAATLGPAEVAEALRWPNVIGLGEVMNYPAVASNDEKMHAEMAEAREAGKVIGGHYPSFDLGRLFHGYVAAGPEDDHEGTRLEDAVARARQGMKVMLRQGSAWHDVAEQARAILESGIDPRHFLLVTDDSHSETLVDEGHVDRVVRVAMKSGLPAMTALQMATINTAEHFGVSREVGMIAPGRWADVLVVSDLDDLRMDIVLARGIVVAEGGQVRAARPAFSFPDVARHSVWLPRSLQATDFRIPVSGNGRVRLNVIGVIENQAPTRHLRVEAEPADGEVSASLTADLAKVALVDRHHGTGAVQMGFVRGFGLSVRCAIGSTVAHDSHQMLIVGTDEQDMALAGNELARMGGGQVVAREGRIAARVELPIAGLMSDEPAEAVAAKAATLLAALRQCGCSLHNANMQLSLLALVVIPELRMSDRGLVDVREFRVIPVVEEGGL